MGNLESIVPSVKFHPSAPAVQKGHTCHAQVCFASCWTIPGQPSSFDAFQWVCFSAAVIGTGMGVKHPSQNKECAALETFSSKDPPLSQPAQPGILQMNWESSKLAGNPWSLSPEVSGGGQLENVDLAGFSTGNKHLGLFNPLAKWVDKRMSWK